MAPKRKLRLEVQQSNEDGEYGIPQVPRWYGQHAAITTKDITGSVMKILITDSNGKQIAISIGENGSIYEIKRNTEHKEKYGISMDPSDQENRINNVENTNHDNILPSSQETVQQSKNSLENSSVNFIHASCDLNLESVKVEPEEYDEFNSIEPSVSFKKVVGVISEGYVGSETLIETLELVDEFHQRIERIKTEETDLAGQFETVYINSAMPPGSCEISRPVPEQSTEPSASIIESPNNSSRSLLCRLCAIQRKDMIHLFEPSKAYENVIEKIHDCLSVLVRVDDTLPQHVCRYCLEKLELFHKFRKTVAEAEEQFFNTARISEELRKDTGKDSRTYMQCSEQNDAEESAEVIVIDEEIPNTNETSTSNLIMENTEPVNGAELITVEKDNAHSLQSEIVEKNEADEDVVFVGERSKMERVTTERFKYDITRCRICGLLFLDAKSCYKHSKIHTSKNYYPCAMCDSVYDESDESFLHSLSHTSYKLSPSLAVLYTKKKKPNYNLRSYNNKKKSSSLNSTKKLTEKDNADDVRNLSPDDKRVKCRICGIHFDNAEECFSHSFIHSSRNQYPCSMCDKIFTNKDDIRRHSQEHAVPKNTQKRAELIVKKVSEINQQCSLIISHDKSSNNAETMLEKDGTNDPNILCGEKEVENHISYDPNDIDDMIKCRICGVYFETAEDCYLHSSIKHISGIQRPCSMCDQSFTNEDDRLIHSLEHKVPRNPWKRMKLCIKNVSDIDPQPSPNISINTFLNITETVAENDDTAIDNDVEEAVQNHIPDDQDDNIDMVKCRICGRYFGTTRSCYSHSLIHISGNQYPCSMCDTILTNEGDSRRHSHEHIKPRKLQSRIELCLDKLSDVIQQFSPTMSTNGLSNIAGNMDEQKTSNNGDILGGKKGLKTHISDDESDNNDMIKCQICGMYFGTVKNCYLHSIIHVSENQYPCSMCDKILTNENDRRIHSHEHIVFKKPRRRMENNILCDEEDKNQTAGDGNNDTDMVKCRICGRYFGTTKSCYMHSIVHVSENQYPCSMCDKIFTNKVDSRIHSHEHLVPRKPRNTSEQLTKKKILDKRRRTHFSNRKHRLNDLKRRAGRAEMIADIIIHDEEQEEAKNHTSDDRREKDDEMIECRICGITSPNAIESYSHSAIHVQKNYYPCTMCDKNFTSEKEAYRHNIDHVMIKLKGRETAGVNVCCICGKRYGSEIRLRFHETYHDPKKIPCYCEKCDKTMSSELSLYYHMRNIHNWPKNTENTCMVCGKRFETRSQLGVHKWSHVNHAYNCSFCDRKLVTEEDLRLHKSNFCQSSVPANIYNCFHCEQKFLHKSSLGKHMREHMGEGPYRSDHCPKTNSTEESQNDFNDKINNISSCT